MTSRKRARTASNVAVATFIACSIVACGGPAPGTIPFPVCVSTVVGDVDVPTQQAVDILIVVDNSGSMQEEQANLAANFLNQNAAECPLTDLKNIPAEFKNPVRDLYTGTGVLAKCGFIQLVAAFDSDWRIGVITTDVAVCDGEFGNAPAGWGFRPQRGCLHGDGAPETAPRKVMARADLEDDDATNDDLGTRFQATLTNIGTFGSPIERGLDAMDVFLDPAGERNPDCTDDLAAFRRDDASLVVIFLSDEEDCSHGLGGADAVFGDELVGDTCGEFQELVANVPPSHCYDAVADLSAVDLYATSLFAHDPRAKVAVIAGSVDGLTADGCLVGGDGLPTGGDDVCYQSEGLSNFVGPGEPCGDTPDANTATLRDGRPCCTADAAGRYYAFADQIGNKATNSICNQSFRDTMLDLAAFIAAVDVITLAQAPDSPNAILVGLTRAGSDTEETLLQVTDIAACDTTTGWILEDETHLRLCGEARGGPGDKVRVRARAADVAEASCAQPFFEASGGGANCANVGGAGGAGGAASIATIGVVLALVRRRRTR